MPMDALEEFLKRDRSVVNDDGLTSPEVKKLKKAIRHINAVRKIADRHTGNVADEIGTLASLALIELNDLLATRDQPRLAPNPLSPEEPSAVQEVKMHEPAIRLKK